MIERSESIANLAAALSAAQGEFPNITKGETANAGTYTYTYADLAAIRAAVQPVLTKHGLSVVQFPGDGVLTTMLLHASGEFIMGGGDLIGATTSQARGSAITYERRYQLSAVLNLATEDDDDGKQAQEGGGQKGGNQRRSSPVSSGETHVAPAGSPAADILRASDLDPDHGFLKSLADQYRRKGSLSTAQLEKGHGAALDIIAASDQRVDAGSAEREAAFAAEEEPF